MFALSILLVPLPAHQHMHIPDGYLSPATALVLFALVLPFWVRGARRLSERMTARQAPLIALCAAFAFVIMMFNVPLPGGTTGHAVGGALAAIILGPEIAAVAVSLALLIQAFFFGDGGILALGANCFNMAVVLPYTSYAVYRILASRLRPARPSTPEAGAGPATPAAPSAGWRGWAAAIGGYVGLTLSALCTAVEFGLQPVLFHASDGTPLYAPYPLAVAIPAMVIPHMLVASVVEAALTGGVVAYLLRTDPSILGAAVSVAAEPRPAAVPGGRLRRLRVLWLALLALIVATPLGLLAPGTAWGEWSREELATARLGFVPAGMARLQGLWAAPLAGYDLPALRDAAAGYAASAALGVAILAGLAWLLTAALAWRGSRRLGHERLDHEGATVTKTAEHEEREAASAPASGVPASSGSAPASTPTAAPEPARPASLTRALSPVEGRAATHGPGPSTGSAPGNATVRAGRVRGGRRVRAASLAGIGEALESSLFAERIARRPGLLQALDPRVKLLTTLGLLLAISLSRSLFVICGLYALTLLLAARSAVPLGFFVKRVWLFMPFFTGLIALPALFLVPGPPLLRLPLGLIVTRSGLAAAAFLVLRVGASVSAAVLLVLTTPWNSLLKALAVLRVPAACVVILGMTYRYIYVLLRLAGDMLQSRQSRAAGRLSGRDQRRLIAASAGVLLSRSLQLSEQVYLAMQARGLRGAPRTMDTFRLAARDWLYAAAAVAVVGAAVWLGR